MPKTDKEHVFMSVLWGLRVRSVSGKVWPLSLLSGVNAGGMHYHKTQVENCAALPRSFLGIYPLLPRAHTLTYRHVQTHARAPPAHTHTLFSFLPHATHPSALTQARTNTCTRAHTHTHTDTVHYAVLFPAIYIYFSRVVGIYIWSRGPATLSLYSHNRLVTKKGKKLHS